jgi:hypothetical protein
VLNVFKKRCVGHISDLFLGFLLIQFLKKVVIMANNKRKKSKNRKNNVNKKRKNNTGKKDKTWLFILTGVLVIAALAIVILNLNLPPTREELAAKVNGREITMQELDESYERLSPLYQSLLGKKGLLDEMINQQLFVEEAYSRNMTVSEQEVNNTIYLFMVNNLMNLTELQDALDEEGMTMEDFREIYTRKILIDNLFSDVLKDINVTDEEAEAYYDENSDLFNVSYENVSENIKLFIESQKQQQAITEFINELRENADIEIYLEDEYEPVNFTETENETTTEETEVNEIAEEDISVENVIAENITEEENITNIIVEETEEELIEEETENWDLAGFAECLAEKGTVLYVYGKNNVNQIDMFEGFFDKYLQFVDCKVDENPQIQQEVCDNANVKGYPTWIIGDGIYKGEQTLQDLSEISGCELN